MLQMRSSDVMVRFFKTEKLPELLHVELLVNHCNFLHTAVDGLFQHSFALKELIFIDQLQKWRFLLFGLISTVETFHTTLFFRILSVLFRFESSKNFHFFMSCHVVLLDGDEKVQTDRLYIQIGLKIRLIFTFWYRWSYLTNCELYFLLDVLPFELDKHHLTSL